MLICVSAWTLCIAPTLLTPSASSSSTASARLSLRFSHQPQKKYQRAFHFMNCKVSWWFLEGDLCGGLLWSLGDWQVVLRGEDWGRVGRFWHHFFHMFPTFVYSYLTLRNGGIALAQAHIASLIIFVSQCVNLCIVYLTSTKYAKISCSIIKKRPNCFSEGSSICATTLFATPSAMSRSAGQPRHQDHLHHHQGKPIQGPLLLNHPYPLPLRHLLLHPRLVTFHPQLFLYNDYHPTHPPHRMLLS